MCNNSFFFKIQTFRALTQFYRPKSKSYTVKGFIAPAINFIPANFGDPTQLFPQVVDLSVHKNLPGVSQPVQFSPPPCNLITKTFTLIDQLTVSFIPNLDATSSKAFNAYC